MARNASTISASAPRFSAVRQTERMDQTAVITIEVPRAWSMEAMPSGVATESTRAVGQGTGQSRRLA